MTNSHPSTLFHYTSRMDNLLSILKNGLKFSYAKEDFGNGHIVGIPMISFCDIPLKQSYEHKRKYGQYAIGLSKQYLLENYRECINPVMYCLNDFQIKAAYRIHSRINENDDIVNDAIERSKDKKTPITITDSNGFKYSGYAFKIGEADDAIKAFFENLSLPRDAYSLLGFMKHYHITRKDKQYVSYDECEWRMVLPENAILGDSKCKWVWENYDSWKQQRHNKFVDNAPCLNITPEMLSYIIVPSEAKASILIDKIIKKQLFGEQSTNICSKVLSFEQIEKDF